METIKEEKKADLEQLLNSLIEKGWKPRGLDRIKGGIIYCGPKGGITFQHKGKVIDFCGADYVLYNGEEYLDYDSYMTHLDDSVIVDINHIFGYRKPLRELCSKESGLWQFVCENEMVKKPDIDRGEVHNWDNPNHWLCESSLKDESELEDFLLSNINVDE